MLEGTGVGDSVATAGVCLTVTRVRPRPVLGRCDARDRAAHDPGRLGRARREPRARADAVSRGSAATSSRGHVDGVGTLSRGDARRQRARRRHRARPTRSGRLCVPQGSIAVDGVSLTLVDVATARLRVSLIPHTAAATTLRGCARRRSQSRGRPDRKVRSRVRLEGPAARGADLGEAGGNGVPMMTSKTSGQTEARRATECRRRGRGRRSRPSTRPSTTCASGRFVIVCDDEDRENEGDLTHGGRSSPPRESDQLHGQARPRSRSAWR